MQHLQVAYATFSQEVIFLKKSQMIMVAYYFHSLFGFGYHLSVVLVSLDDCFPNPSTSVTNYIHENMKRRLQ